KGSERSENQRLLRQIAGIRDEVACRKIVRAVADDVEVPYDAQGILRGQPEVEGFDVDVRVQSPDGFACTVDLRYADIRSVMQDLPLQVVQRDDIIIDDPDGADTGRGEIKRNRRAKAAGAHDQDTRLFQPLLARATDIPQNEMPLVALDFFGTERHQPFPLGALARITGGRARLSDGCASCVCAIPLYQRTAAIRYFPVRQVTSEGYGRSSRGTIRQTVRSRLSGALPGQSPRPAPDPRHRQTSFRHHRAASGACSGWPSGQARPQASQRSRAMRPVRDCRYCRSGTAPPKLQDRASRRTSPD